MKPLFIHKIGSGKPLLVIHGGPGLGYTYLTPHLNNLGKIATAIFYDQRGSGKSKDCLPMDPLTLYIQDIEFIRTSSGLENFDILAHSWGGFLAAQYAVQYPERIGRLIFLDSAPLSTVDYQEYVTLRAKRIGNSSERLSQLESLPEFSAGNPKIFEKFYQILFQGYFYNPENSSDLHFGFDKESALASLDVYQLFIDHVMNRPFDLYEELSPLRDQILVVHGDNDPIPLHFIRKIPHAKFQLINQCGHFPFIEQPEVLFEILKEFLEKVPLRTS